MPPSGSSSKQPIPKQGRGSWACRATTSLPISTIPTSICRVQVASRSVCKRFRPIFSRFLRRFRHEPKTLRLPTGRRMARKGERSGRPCSPPADSRRYRGGVRRSSRPRLVRTAQTERNDQAHRCALGRCGCTPIRQQPSSARRFAPSTRGAIGRGAAHEHHRHR